MDRDLVRRLTNEARAANGRPALKRSRLLDASAQARARRLAKTGALEHGTWWKAIYRVAGKTRFRSLGENIAEGQDTQGQVVREWMASPTHRDNILGSYNRLGVGFARRGDTEYWCQHFGRR